MRILVLAIAVLAGCAERPEAPAVHVITLDGSDVLPVYVQGAAAWSPLGLDASTESSGLPECGLSWYVFGELQCEITIGIRRDPLLRESRGTNALSSRPERTITIDSDLTDPYALEIAIAHEAGHILLDTAEHTRGGIMGGASLSMADVDRELACRAIQICI